MTRLTTLNLPEFHRATIGFDRMFNQLNKEFANSKSQGYPPYNVVEVDEDEYMISLAVDEDTWASKDSRVVLCKPRDNQRVK